MCDCGVQLNELRSKFKCSLELVFPKRRMIQVQQNNERNLLIKSEAKLFARN